ncbi:MAG: ABC transporter permease [Lachnospiraceae bacterium]|nr:ABC transporter permease [Lachnospiraceae bacterium]
MGKKAINIALGFIPLVVITVLWWYANTFTTMSQAVLPKIGDVVKTFVETFKNGQMQEDLIASFDSVIKGYLIAAVVGITIGSLMGIVKPVKAILQPTITCIRQIPMIAWMPLIILWCGIGQLSKVVLIVVASTFPILVNTQNGIETIPSSYVEVAKLYKLSVFETFFRVYLPHALQGILVGLKLGLSVSWMAVVGAELIASTTGIGYRMSMARTLMQSTVLLSCIVVVGFVGILMDKLLGLLFAQLTPWEKVKSSK